MISRIRITSESVSSFTRRSVGNTHVLAYLARFAAPNTKYVRQCDLNPFAGGYVDTGDARHGPDPLNFQKIETRDPEGRFETT